MKKTIEETFKIGDDLWEIVKQVFENENKMRTEVKYYVHKNGENITYLLTSGYTHCDDIHSAREVVLLSYIVVG